ncbi:MAG TPA: hypothetical protein VH062_02680 [Polyangiaceae bacterium]|nr:hypothetical protein [Polyangiaceae bacterium]
MQRRDGDAVGWHACQLRSAERRADELRTGWLRHGACRLAEWNADELGGIECDPDGLRADVATGADVAGAYGVRRRSPGCGIRRSVRRQRQ